MNTPLASCCQAKTGAGALGELACACTRAQLSRTRWSRDIQYSTGPPPPSPRDSCRTRDACTRRSVDDAAAAEQLRLAVAAATAEAGRLLMKSASTRPGDDAELLVEKQCRGYKSFACEARNTGFKHWQLRLAREATHEGFMVLSFQALCMESNEF